MAHQYTPGSVIHFVTSFEIGYGEFVDPTVPKVVIQNPSGDLTEVALINQGMVGKYAVDWTVPADAAQGFWDYYFKGTVTQNNVASQYASPMDFFEVVGIGAVTDDLPAGLYCTIADVRGRLPTLLVADMSDEKVLTAIQEAMAEIDANLYNRYVVPFTVVPWMIRQIAKDLAVSTILNVVNSSDGATEEVPLEGRTRSAGQRKLESLAAGRITLPGVAFKQRARLNTYNFAENRSTMVQLFECLDLLTPGGLD